MALLLRLVDVYGHPGTRSGRWLRNRAPQVVAALEAAATRRGVPRGDLPPGVLCGPDADLFEITGSTVRARACPSCGHRHRARTLIPEIVGAVCRRCRCDDAGHRWPARPYNRYLDQ